MDIRIKTVIREIIASINQEVHGEFLRKGWRLSRRANNGIGMRKESAVTI